MKRRGGGTYLTLLVLVVGSLLASLASCSGRATETEPIGSTSDSSAIYSEDTPVTAGWKVPADNGQFPVNAKGESYGSALDAATSPDLIVTVATNGKEGYVRLTDLEPMPANPEEALRLQQVPCKNTLIPVYLSDGQTVVGEFEIKCPLGQ